MSGKLASRKLWLSIAAAVLPLISKAIWPDLDTTVIVTSVIGAVAGVMGISMEDVAKQKRAAVEAAAAPLDKPSEG
tara:strand:- start:621 stop:848 length:228 start_codon:yes stop_codon:yes gene_type:complete